MTKLGPALAALLLAATGGAAAADAARGRALFEGSAPLPARVHGQDFALPAQASRCVNCHVAPAATAASTVAVGAPPLTAAALSAPTRRRGGPPSRYDAASLCTLLRKGIDPAHVMIERTMPRYEITEADCQALWLHLMERR